MVSFISSQLEGPGSLHGYPMTFARCHLNGFAGHKTNGERCTDKPGHNSVGILLLEYDLVKTTFFLKISLLLFVY